VIEKKEPKEKQEEKVHVLKAISVLDAKRAQNVGIFIRSNKLENEKRVPDISKIKEGKLTRAGWTKLKVNCITKYFQPFLAIFELDLSEVKLETLEKILDIVSGQLWS